MREDFPPTQWSVVLSAVASGADKRTAIGRLLSAYWYPLYCCARRLGRSPEDAEDSVQGFCARFIATDDWRVDPAQGRFRHWLVVALRNFLANERDRERAGKRGGGVRHVPIDDDAERRFLTAGMDRDSPERAFERGLARSLLAQEREALLDEERAAGRGATAAALLPWLAPGSLPPYADLAASLATSVGALRVGLHRLRRRYGELVRRRILAIVRDPSDVDDEVRSLLAALAD